MLEVRNLVKHYQVGDGEPIRALDGVSLSIAAGEFVALYGPSGSGKSTLLDLIAGFQPPDRGMVLVEGCDVAHLSERDHADYLSRVLGIIGQPGDLLPGALAEENAALKLVRTDPRHATRLIEPLLVQLGLGGRMKQRTKNLSMGERQRVMIAQALSTDPRVVLADEPTGNLDTRTSIEVMGIFQRLNQERGITVVLITHELDIAEYGTRTVTFRDGQVVADKVVSRRRLAQDELAALPTAEAV
jgi:putative ABC transport system ATP-binding protein